MMLIPFAHEITIAPEDDLRAFTITSEDAGLSLIDSRGRENFSGFIVFANLPSNSSKQQFSMKITARVNHDWRREPVIQVSQVGYHPMQKKVAILELDSRIQKIENMKLVYLDKNGTKRLAKSGKPVKRGPLFGTHIGKDAKKVKNHDFVFEKVFISPFGARPFVFFKFHLWKSNRCDDQNHCHGDQGEDPIQGDPRQICGDDLGQSFDNNIFPAGIAL